MRNCPIFSKESSSNILRCGKHIKILAKRAEGAGPMDQKTARLVKLALAVGAKSEGAVHSHTRRALKQGISPEELQQVALLAVTSIGWSPSMAALSWIQDVV